LERNPSSTVLMNAMAELYEISHQPERALEYYLKLHRADVFDMIKKNNLFSDVMDKILLLMDFDDRRVKDTADPGNRPAIALLTSNIDKVPVGGTHR
jgi:hypothetical protein